MSAGQTLPEAQREAWRRRALRAEARVRDLERFIGRARIHIGPSDLFMEAGRILDGEAPVDMPAAAGAREGSGT